MRLLHTSDWHLGRSLVQTSLHDQQAEFLRWLLAQAVEHRVDAVLVAGDVYDRAYPSTDSVRLLDDTFVAFAAAGIPLVLVSGNHDSAVRLGFGGDLTALAGIHLRTAVEEIAAPIVLSDAHGEVAVYGIPYLLPDAAMAELGSDRSHTGVLSAATTRILDDARARGITRTVVLSHAFVTGGVSADSERDIRVGGVGDAPANVFDGVTYVALGHLHRPQQISLPDSTTVLRYSGSPLAFSFSERHDTKSVALVDLGSEGVAGIRTLATPASRPLREVEGRLDDLLARASTDLADLADCFVKVILTDPSRPAAPMEQLRRHWPHTLVLDFRPDGERISSAADLDRSSRTTDPTLVCEHFVEYVDRVPPTESERLVLRDAVEQVRHEVSA